MNGYKDDHMKFSFMDPNKKVAAPSLESWLTSLQLEELEVPRPLCVSMVILNAVKSKRTAAYGI